jgi:biotin transport system substrate-specific component
VRKNKKQKNVAIISIGAVLLALFSLVTIPAPIPFTLQLFGVALILLTFGGKRGTASIVVYLALGALGLPVFSGFGAGIGTLVGPTGGFLFGFVAMGLIYILFEKRSHAFGKTAMLALALGTLVCYALGTAMFVVWSGANNAPVSFFGALSTCVIPCIIPDALKIYLAYTIYEKRLSKLKI